MYILCPDAGGPRRRGGGGIEMITWRTELHLTCDGEDHVWSEELMLDQYDAKTKKGMEALARKIGWTWCKDGKCYCPECSRGKKGGYMSVVGREVFVLLANGDGTLCSMDTPWGVAVTSEEEAKAYVKEGGIGYSHSFTKVTIFDSFKKARKFVYGR